MDREELKRLVKVKLDEISPFDDHSFLSVGSDEVKPISDYIEATLDDACNEALLLIPLHLIDLHCFKGNTIVKFDNETGYVILPSDFIRLGMFKMCSWKRPVVFPASTEENLEYIKQSNPYTRGGTTKPVCILSTGFEPTSGNLTRVLEYYSIPKYLTPKIEIAKYVKQFDSDNIQESLTEYYTLLTASKILDILGVPIADKLREELALKIKINTK